MSLFRTFHPLLATLLLSGISWSAALPHPNLRHLTRQSGYIFVGTVIAVGRVAPSGNVPTMKVTFRVEQAIRGVIKGQTFVLNEWAGVWEAEESYRRGERVLLFLYRPSKLGLSSPVGGQQGRFKLDSNGMAVLRQEQMAAWFPPPPSPAKVLGATRIRITDFARAIHEMEEE